MQHLFQKKKFKYDTYFGINELFIIDLNLLEKESTET